MNLLRRWLGALLPADRTPPARPETRRRFRPTVERLENHLTPTVTNHLGGVLPNVQVHAPFWLIRYMRVVGCRLAGNLYHVDVCSDLQRAFLPHTGGVGGGTETTFP